MSARAGPWSPLWGPDLRTTSGTTRRCQAAYDLPRTTSGTTRRFVMPTWSAIGEQQELDRFGVDDLGIAQMADGFGAVAKLGQDGIGVFACEWR